MNNSIASLKVRLWIMVAISVHVIKCLTFVCIRNRDVGWWSQGPGTDEWRVSGHQPRHVHLYHGGHAPVAEAERALWWALTGSSPWLVGCPGLKSRCLRIKGRVGGSRSEAGLELEPFQVSVINCRSRPFVEKREREEDGVPRIGKRHLPPLSLEKAVK